MKFRTDINGLRFIAVTMVVLYHYGFSTFSGGFVGVDIFFVISGFLMTSIITKGITNNEFSLWKFYCARAKRIIPSLVLVIALVLILGWFTLFPTEYYQLGKHSISSLFFISDIVYWKEAGYFDSGATEKWLLHTWSLSVEWQFYIFYPILVALIKKFFGDKRITISLSVMLITSLIISIYASIYRADAGFFLLPSRAWEMLAGGVISQIKPKSIFRKFTNPIQYLSILALLACCVVSTSTGWPGYKAITPVGLTSLIIYLNNKNRILDNFFSQHIGKISYSMYLWHWPVYCFLAMLSKESVIIYKLLGLAISYLLSIITYNLIETKSSQKSIKITSRIIFTTLTILSLFIILDKGVIEDYRKASESNNAKLYEKYRTMHDNWHGFYKDGCDFYSVKDNKHKDNIDNYCIKKTHENGIFLWGDSHAQALSVGIRSIIPHNWDFYQVATSSCEPTIGRPLKKAFLDNNCRKSNTYAIDKIKELKPTIVIISQRSLHRFNDWNKIALTIKGYGVKQVVVLGPMVQWNDNLAKLIARKGIKTIDGYSDMNYVEKEVYKDDSSFDKIDKKDFIYISLLSNMCKRDKCMSYVPKSENLMVMDYGHLTHEGSIYVAKKIIDPKIKYLE